MNYSLILIKFFGLVEIKFFEDETHSPNIDQLPIPS